MAGLLSVGLLTACSKKDPAPAETTGADTTVEEVTKGETDAAPVETDPVEETEAPADETTAEIVTEPVTEPETTAEPETYPDLNLPTDAAGVVELIDSISAGTIENEWDIDRAYAAWAALSEADRAKVTNYDKLRQLLQEVADAHVVKDYQDRIPHGELLLGAYFGPTPTDEKLQVAVDGYLDFFCGVSNDQNTLNQYAKFGLGAFVSGGSFGVSNYHVGGSWNYEGRQNLDTARAIKSVELMVQAASQLAAKDHEAIWGIDYRDEPGASDFWFYNYVINATNDAYTQVQTFANLLPNYGGANQLGTYGYRRHVLDYAHRVNGDILSLDHYFYAVQDQDGFFRGMGDIADAAKQTDKDVMVILQLNHTEGSRLTTLGEVKFQAYASMAYGAKYLVWACYNGGWFVDQALDGNQNPTEQYYKMQECNADLKVLSPIFMRYTSVDQTMLNPMGTREYIAAQHPLASMDIKTVTELSAGEGTKNLLMGYYEKNVGEGEAFLFVNTHTFDYNSNNTETSTVSFRTVSPSSVVTAYVKGVPTILTPVDGVYTVTVVDADAVFVTVTEPDSLNPATALPMESIIIDGTDIGDYSIVIPAAATLRERQAAEVLVATIQKAVGKTLPIVTDEKAPAHGIYLGNTSASTSYFRNLLAELTNDGYAIRLEDGNLYISGQDTAGAGTLFGVYAFCEDVLNIHTYADGCTTYGSIKVELFNGLSEYHSPSFSFRDTTNYTAMEQPTPLFQKYNGYSVFGDVNFSSVQFGGYALHRLCGVNDQYDTAVICLSNESVYTTALNNAKVLLNADPYAEYLACDIGLNGEWTPCSCDTCTAAVAADGVMGFTLAFANRLAADLKADYPNVKVVVTAGGENLSVPATVRPAENVAVRVAMSADACRFHDLGDESCEANAALREALEGWCEVCDHVILLDQITERTAKDVAVFTASNPLALYDTVQFIKELGVVGYQQTGYDVRSGEFEALNAYLLSILLWDADMTREEYLAKMDGFLAAYYGAGATYIRQYIDKFFNTDGLAHSDFKSDNAMIFRTADKSFGKACCELWKNAMDATSEAVTDAMTSEQCKNVKYSSIQALKISQAIRDNQYSGIFRSQLVGFGFPG